MELWIALLAERAAGDAVEAVSGSSGPGCEALILDVHRLEGYSLVCLASHDEAIRREAMQVRCGKGAEQRTARLPGLSLQR